MLPTMAYFSIYILNIIISYLEISSAFLKVFFNKNNLIIFCIDDAYDGLVDTIQEVQYWISGLESNLKSQNIIGITTLYLIFRSKEFAI